MKKILFFAYILLSAEFSFASTIDLSQLFSGAVAGQGIITSAGTLSPFTCVEVDASAVHASPHFIVKSEFLEIETIDELKKITKGGFMLNELFETKLQTSLTSSRKNKVLKITLSFLQKQTGLPKFKLSKNFETLARNGLFVEFASSCGSEFISTIASGHKLHIFMILSSEKEAGSKEFEAALKLNLTDILSKISGTESIEHILGKLELAANIMQKLEQLTQKVHLEYTIAMTGAGGIDKEDKLLSMNNAPFQTGISDHFSESGNDLTELLLILTKRFPQFALTEMTKNPAALPLVEGQGESFKSLLANSYFGKNIGELDKNELADFLKSNREFSLFNSTFSKLEERASKVDLFLSKALKIEKRGHLKLGRAKAFKSILKFLRINKQSLENIEQYCRSSSLVYPECFAMAFGKNPEDKSVGSSYIQIGNDFTCIESNDFAFIDMCLGNEMEPFSCRKMAFSEFSKDKGSCEKKDIDILKDLILPVRPENL